MIRMRAAFGALEGGRGGHRAVRTDLDRLSRMQTIPATRCPISSPPPRRRWSPLQIQLPYNLGPKPSPRESKEGPWCRARSRPRARDRRSRLGVAPPGAARGCRR
jgi:hypothetical protein